MKKIIRFAQCHTIPVVGLSCVLTLAENHPNTSTRTVSTSAVVAFECESGVSDLRPRYIETLNTIYVRNTDSIPAPEEVLDVELAAA